MENDKQQVTWGRWFAEHAAGTAILGTAMAGIGAATALYRGKPLKPEITTYAALGTLSGLGFGRMVYTGLFGKSASQAPSDRSETVTWAERIERERQVATDRHR